MSSENPTTRERILKAAWQLLEADPGGGVRMSDIAKAAGISRQAVYLHFPARADLLVAATRYIDEVTEADVRLAPSRAAKTGRERLPAYIEAWSNHIPEIHGVAKALIAMQETDEAARVAWADRLAAIRHGFEAAVRALKLDGDLTLDYSETEAVDLLLTLISVETWESLTVQCGWTQERFIASMQALAAQTLIVPGKE
ncbi:MAG: TetR/AcrR family transcriptional regulator [Pseudomonadota bacterium]